MNITEPVVRCLQRLKAPEFEPLIEWLGEVHQKSLELSLEVQDADQWRVLKGRVKLAKELLDLVKSSDELAAKLSRPQR